MALPGTPQTVVTPPPTRSQYGCPAELMRHGTRGNGVVDTVRTGGVPRGTGPGVPVWPETGIN